MRHVITDLQLMNLVVRRGEEGEWEQLGGVGQGSEAVTAAAEPRRCPLSLSSWVS